MARQLVDALVAQVRSDPSLDLTSPAALAIMTADLPTRAEAVALLAAELKDEMMGGFLGRLGKTTPKAPALHRVLVRTGRRPPCSRQPPGPAEPASS